jgi:16S rRNA (cytosine967-C5)-methyltransferase
VRAVVSDARRLAFDVALAVEQGARSDAALGSSLARATLSPEDRALATRIVYGTAAWQGRLDHTIAAYADRSVDAIDVDARLALRIGAYQLLLLDRVPDYAAVDSSVGLLRGPARRSAGFVNAVLRRIAREGEAAPPAGVDEAAAITLSHPLWLVRLWRRELGHADAEALMRANNEAAPTVLRALVPREQALATLVTEGHAAVPARWAPDAIVCDVAIARHGLVVPHGEASQLVTLLVGATTGERVLDACAAPGGKTAYLASKVGADGEVTAVDPGRDATRRIQSLLHVCGARARIVSQRIQDFSDDRSYDAVLVDAPCSGLGTLREHPEIRWRRREADLAGYAARQTEMLGAAARLVRPGGRLVYATCTLVNAENDEVVDRFLADNPRFRPDIEALLHPALAPLVDAQCRLRTAPHVHGTSGFFAARMVRSA